MSSEAEQAANRLHGGQSIPKPSGYFQVEKTFIWHLGMIQIATTTLTLSTVDHDFNEVSVDVSGEKASGCWQLNAAYFESCKKLACMARLS